MDTNDQTPAGLVSLRQAAALTGLHHHTIRRVARDEGVTIFVNPGNKRHLLIDANALRQALTLRPILTDAPTP